MRRRYDSSQFVSFARKVCERVPNVGLGTDVMVGFPGEDRSAFEKSFEMINNLSYTNVHVFSFSSRPRTAAYNMKNKVSAEVIRKRSAEMHNLAEKKKAEFC